MSSPKRKKILVIDLSVKRTSPAGSCVLSELIGLSETYDILLVGTEIEESLKKNITFHQINAPSSPLVLRYIIFSIKAKAFIKGLMKRDEHPYIIQTTQGQYVNCDISYPHFCHRAYLQKHWKNSSIKGTRRILRKLNHLYNAKMEAKAFKNAKVIVTPSKGLSRELIETYPFCKDKVKVIANPVDIEYYRKPADFSLIEREVLGLSQKDIVISFAALGDFARKGLPELMASLKENTIKDSPFKILIIGGKPEEIAQYQKKGAEMGVNDQLVFVGFQKDIRPFLWMSDIFALPSIYEIFPLVCIQAAAAGLPILATEMHGVEEYLKDVKNGWLVERNGKSIGNVLKGVAENKYDLAAMGKFALESVKQYDHASFREKWLNVYRTHFNSNY